MPQRSYASVMSSSMSRSKLVVPEVANGIVQALDMLGSKATKPIVVRLDGNNVELGRKILNDANHPLVEQLETMDGAAAKAAELAAR